MSSLAGPKRLGKYELQETIGRGGMAEVWKAHDPKLERDVAIKLLSANKRIDPEFKARFSREARLVAKLHHPNIVQIYDFQTTHSLEADTSIAYMVMDYVEGETLADYIERTSHAGQFPAPTDIVHLFASVGKALDYAHQKGMIHRDIKPANLLLDKRHTGPHSMGEPVLTDFGIAKIVEPSSDTKSVGSGTPSYMSPEQVLGNSVTKQSDIYSLGVILYEICTGVCPFRGAGSIAIMAQHVNSPPPPPPLFNAAIPSPLAEVILQALAKDPAKRFSSASALAVAIAEAFHLPVPAGLLPAQSSDDRLATTKVGPRQPRRSPFSTVLQVMQQPRSPTMKASPSLLSTVPTIKPPPIPASRPPVRSGRTWKRNLIAWVVVLFVLASSILVSIYLLNNVYASPTVGTLTFTSSGQYNPDMTAGYNDGVTLSLHGLTTPGTGMADFAWLLPDQGDDGTPPLLLGRLPVSAGNAPFQLQYPSPTHENLLARYSGLRITEQSANDNPSIPSLDPKTWRWEGWIPNTPNAENIDRYSLLDHLRHLLAKDPTLQDNSIPGGLVIWMTRNVGKVQEWSSAAQGGWGSQMSDGDADLIHRHLIRILDYLDGQTYVGQDVPAGTPWLVEPTTLPGGKFGLLNYIEGQYPPGYLQHVDIHLTGLEYSPSHTDEQKQVAIQADGVVQRMINDLTQVRKDAQQLVQRSNAQLLQSDTLTLLNDMATLTGEANSGWYDSTTHENQGGAIWLKVRLQQLATISLQASNRQ